MGASTTTSSPRREEHQTFLIKLNEQLRGIADPEELQAAVMRALAEYLGVARAQYFEIDLKKDLVRTSHGYSTHPVEMPNEFRNSDFGEHFPNEYIAGRTVTVNDTETAAFLSEGDRASLRAIGSRSGIGVPLLKNGELIAVVAVHDSKPRSWTPAEVDLVEAAAERTWAALERVKAEDALKRTEDRLQLALAKSKMGTFVWDVETDRVEADERMLELCGSEQSGELTVEQFLFWTIHREDRERCRAELQRSIDPNGDGGFQTEARFIKPGGEVCWTSIMGRTVFEGRGPNATLLYGMATDVTKRKLGEAHTAFLDELSYHLSRLNDPDVIMEMVGRRCAEFFKVSGCVFMDVDEERRQVSGPYGWTVDGLPALKRTFRMPNYLTEEFVRDNSAGRMFVISDSASDERPDTKHFDALGIGALVSIPFHWEGKWTGFFAVVNKRPKRWTGEELELLNEIAHRTFPRAERARAEATLRINERRTRGQNDALQAAAGGASLADALGCLARMAEEETGGSARTAFYIADPEVVELYTVRGAGDMPESYADRIDGLAIGEESLACGLALPTGEPVLTRDVLEDARWENWTHVAKEFDYRGCWSFPIKTRDDKGVGTFAMYFREPREAMPRDLELANIITRSAALIIANHLEAERRRCAEEALREGRGALQSFYDSSPLLMGIAEVDGDTIYAAEANEATARFFGVRAGELTQQTADDLMQPEVNKLWLEKYQEARATKEPVKFDLEHPGEKDDRWLAATVSYLGETTAGRSRFSFVAEDVTDQRKAEQAVRESGERLRLAAEAARLGTWVWDLGTNKVHWNRQHFEMLGIEPGSGPVEADEFFDRVHRDDQEYVRERLNHAIETGAVFEAVFRTIRDDGRVRWMSGYGQLTHREAGMPTEMSGVMLDVTDRMKMEESLRESSERLRLLIESATEVSIFTTDREGFINSWNEGSRRIYGFEEDEVIGQCVEILYTPEDQERKAHLSEMQAAIDFGQAMDERWHLRKDGSQFYASGLTQPLGDDGEQGFVKIARDMTERIKAENARREKELMQTLVEAQERERKRIARDLHDELGQQLTALRFKLDQVSRELPGPIEEEIGEVKAIAKSIDEGVDFLAWELRPAALDDLGLIDALKKYIGEWSRYSGVQGQLNAPGGERRMDDAVETALYRIVQEAMNNIHKHARAKNAEVTVRQRGGRIVLTIDDDGRGFDLKDPEIKHQGIGLIGMNERVQMIGGTFEIESEPGHGTTIYVKAPALGPAL